ncbi:Ig-like domain-containing protein, partial [Geobacillus thermoleovorans]
MKRGKYFIGKILVLFTLFTYVFSPLLAAASTEVIIENPTPDTTPPVLNSLNITATQVSVGGSVKLIADVSDDLSGVKSVYASYRGPKWSKGVSLYFNQTTQKYEGTISFNQYEGGEWVLTSISLVDNKDNSVSIYDDSTTYSVERKMDLSPYTIQVTGGLEDTTPPVLNSIDIQSPSQVSPGDIVKVIADVSDDGSGVSSVSVRFLKPSGRSTNTNLYYNQTSGLYEGSLRIDQYDELGEWKMYSVSMGDKAENYKFIYDSTYTGSSVEKRDFSNYKFQVVETTPDLLGPILESLAISLEQVTKNGALVKLTADSSDNLSGLSHLSAYYTKPNGQLYYVSFSRNYNTGKYEGSILIDKYDQLGTWKLRSISLYDAKSNIRQVFDISQGYGYQEMSDFSPFHFTVRGVITIPPPAPFSIVLAPKAVTLEPGQSLQLKVTLNMTNSETKDITLGSSGTVYTSSNPSAVKVDKNGLVTVDPNASPGIVYIQAANSGLYGQVEIKIPGETNKGSLRIDPISMSLSPGQTKQLNVIATLPDGTVKDVTLGSTGTQYTSTDPSIVSVDQNGLIRVSSDAKPGTFKIQINHNGIIGETVVNVTGPPVVKSLAIAPGATNVIAGETIQLNVRATMSDGTSKDVTAGETGTVYTSSDPTKATVDANGLISIPANATSGTVTITANHKGIIARCVVTVQQDPSTQLADLILDTTSITLAPGQTHQLAVTAKMADGVTTKNVTSGSTGTTYSSSATNVATVSEDGLISIPANAPLNWKSTITVKHGKFTKYVTVTVGSNPANVVSSISADVTNVTIAP